MTAELISLVEIDQPICSLVYGVGACNAVLGVTGASKCYNTWATCQVKDRYNESVTPLTLRFMTECENPWDFLKSGPLENTQALPTLQSVSSRPTELNIIGGDPGASPLGKRARLTATIKDIPYHDRLVDPYWRERLSGAAQANGVGYDPFDRGTFWAKWLARNPNYANIPVRVLRKAVVGITATLTTEHYILDKIDGPGSRGAVSVTAKDVLALADNDRALCPKPSPGRIQDAIADDAALPITATLLPAGVGNGDYSAAGKVRIGKEIFTFTRAADVLTLTARAQDGTTAQAHKADDTAQECYVVDSTRIDSVLSDLLLYYANIPSAFLPVSAWAAEASSWLSTYTLNAVVSEPTGVTKLVGEILQAGISYLWWDSEAQLLRFRAIRPQETTRAVNDRQHILADSLQQETKADERITQLIVFYDQIDPTGRQDDGSNYSRARVFFPPTGRAPNDNDERVKIIFSRWLSDANGAEVLNSGIKIMQRYYQAPLKTSFALDRSQGGTIALADVVDLTHYSITDAEGAPRNFPAQIIAAEYTEGGTRLQLTAIPYDFAGRFAYIMVNGSLPYSGASDNDKQFGAWFAENTGAMPNGDPAYLIV